MTRKIIHTLLFKLIILLCCGLSFAQANGKNEAISVGESLYIRSHRPDGVPVEVKAKVVRVAPGNYGTTRVGVAITETKENWLRLFVAWIADDNVEEVEEEV